MSNHYKINGTHYHVECHFDGEMYEATIQDCKGNILPFYGYGDKPGEARYELSERLFEYDIKPNIDNRYVNWNDLPEEVKHKITVRGRKYKTELMGEWLTDYERIERWTNWMHYAFSDIYPHKFTEQFYKRL